MIRGDNGVTCIQEGLYYGSKVRRTLGVVAEPSAAVNMDHNRVGFLHLLREVDIHIMVYLRVKGVIHIGILSGVFHLYFRELETPEIR